MTTSDTGVCVSCGQPTKDRYFASSSRPQVGSRRPPLPVSLCRTCTVDASAMLAMTAADEEPPSGREDAPSRTV